MLPRVFLLLSLLGATRPYLKGRQAEVIAKWVVEPAGRSWRSEIGGVLMSETNRGQPIRIHAQDACFEQVTDFIRG